MNYSMFFQEATPDTSGYMIAGYVVFVVVMAIYLVSFFTRRRNLEQDLATLQTIESEGKAAAPAVPAPKPGARKALARKARPSKPAAGRTTVKKRASKRR
jgi:hypothetical protein